MTEPAAPWSLRRRLTGRVLGLVVVGWLATIGLGALILGHEMNDMFDDELAALVETTLLPLDASGGRAIPRHMGGADQHGGTDSADPARIRSDAARPLARAAGGWSS